MIRPTSTTLRPALARREPAGFSLIESLVTMVILSIGILALVALQTATLVDSRIASMRNVATMLAYNLADQIRSNELAVTQGAYNRPVAQTTPACFTVAGCTVPQMAATSFRAWLDDVARTLPGGTGTVCVDSTPNDGDPPVGVPAGDPDCDNVAGAPYVIKIWWGEGNGAQNTPVVQRFVTALVP